MLLNLLSERWVLCFISNNNINNRNNNKCFFCFGEEKFSSTLLGSSGWFKNKIDMRQINKRKTKI